MSVRKQRSCYPTVPNDVQHFLWHPLNPDRTMQEFTLVVRGAMLRTPHRTGQPTMPITQPRTTGGESRHEPFRAAEGAGIMPFWSTKRKFQSSLGSAKIEFQSSESLFIMESSIISYFLASVKHTHTHKKNQMAFTQHPITQQVKKIHILIIESSQLTVNNR